MSDTPLSILSSSFHCLMIGQHYIKDCVEYILPMKFRTMFSKIHVKDLVEYIFLANVNLLLWIQLSYTSCGFVDF
jgi:hypothetical protein